MQGELEVINEGAEVWIASFTFAEPAGNDALSKMKQQWMLPSSYEQFLLIHNGASLYREKKYGQWGFHIYNTQELLSKNELWHSIYEDLPPSYLVFAESLGDSDLLIIDTNRQSKIPQEYYILDGDTASPIASWSLIARSFGEWLNYLVVAQGAKYWRWFPCVVAR
jgi:hypothetical protein